MVSVYDAKPRFQALLRPAVRGLARAGVTPNQVTLAALGLSLVAGAAIAAFAEQRLVLLVLPAVLLIRMMLNAIDGMLAREHDMKTHLGMLLNELGDVLADAALYLPLATVPGVGVWPVVAFAFLGTVGELAGVLGTAIGSERRYDGPMGKSDRALVVGVAALLLGCGVEPGRWVDLVFAACSLLAALTVLNRCRGALRGARVPEEGP